MWFYGFWHQRIWTLKPPCFVSWDFHDHIVLLLPFLNLGVIFGQNFCWRCSVRWLCCAAFFAFNKSGTRVTAKVHTWTVLNLNHERNNWGAYLTSEQDGQKTAPRAPCLLKSTQNCSEWSWILWASSNKNPFVVSQDLSSRTVNLWTSLHLGILGNLSEIRLILTLPESNSLLMSKPVILPSTMSVPGCETHRRKLGSEKSRLSPKGQHLVTCKPWKRLFVISYLDNLLTVHKHQELQHRRE